MKCSECGADIFEGISRCPFCKTPTCEIADERFKNFDFTYTITSKEQIKAIRDTVAEVAENSSKSPLDMLPLIGKRQAKESKSKKKSGFHMPDKRNLRSIAILGVALVCLIVVICGVFSFIGTVTQKNDIVSSYTYVKDNAMYLIFKNKTVKLSHNAIDESYLRHSEEDISLPTGTEVAKNTDIVHSSKNGLYTYYFENYDPETESGTLKRIKNGKEKSITVIAEAVHNSIVMTKDGENILFLQATDKNGDMGVLHYWKHGMDEPHKISSDIDHGTFAFSADSKEALFLQNLDRTVMQGDLYSQNLKKLKEEKIKIDTDVCRIFGTDNKSRTYIYAKAFDTSDNSFDIYAYDNKPESDKIRLGERTKLAPHMLKTKNYMFVYGAADDGTNNLYYVNIKNGNKEKIAAGVNQILKISADEKLVMYDKVYNAKTADYYIYTSGKQTQKVAGNVNVDFADVGRSPQLAASDDLSTILYIGGFDGRTGGGKLFINHYKPGKASEPEQIADDVHSCYMTPSRGIVYTKDYSLTRKVFDVYVYSKNTSQLLKDELSPEMFEVSKTGDTVFYTNGFNVTGDFGTLECSDLNGNTEVISDGVFAFDQTKSGDIFFFKNLNTENGQFDLYFMQNEKNDFKHLDSKIDGMMLY